MGGLGSGKGTRRKAWRSKKYTTESLPRIDIVEMVKKTKDIPGVYFVLRDIKQTITGDVINLEVLKGDPLKHSTIRIARIPCHYGGFRSFGCCPCCGRNAKTLYLFQRLFACRRCLKMCYPSQNQTLAQRLRLKYLAVDEKLNKAPWVKPKWMRQKTYKRLKSEHYDLDEKEQIAEFYSARTVKQANFLFKKYGCALIAGEYYMMNYFPGMFSEKEITWLNEHI